MRLVSLYILIDTIGLAENTPKVRALHAAVTAEPLLCVLIAASLTWAVHSSAAVVLLVLPLASSNIVTPVAALALLLGAHFGRAFNPLLERGRSGNPARPRLPAGHMINPGVGRLLAPPVLP